VWEKLKNLWKNGHRTIFLCCACLLIGVIAISAILVPKLNTAKRESEYLRGIVSGYRNAILGELGDNSITNTDLIRETKEQRRNRELAIDAVSRAVSSTENSLSALGKLGTISGEERQILLQIGQLNTKNLGLIKQLLERGGSISANSNK
jgi:hypothetical protein